MTTQTPEQPTWLTIAEVAALARRTENTVRYWRFHGTGNLPRAHKVGRRVLFKRTEIEQWIEDAPED